MHHNRLRFVCLALGVSFLAGAQTAPVLLQPTTARGSITDNDKTVRQARNVTVNFDLLQSANIATVLVPLFGNDQVLLTRDSVSPAMNGGYIWRGHDPKDPTTLATFAVTNRTLAGSIRPVKGRVYDIRYIGNGVHSLREIDPTRFPKDGLSKLRLPPLPDPKGDTCSSDPPTDIDAMVLYTSTSRAAAGGKDAMEATILLAIDVANTAYVNSNITQRLRLVHMEEVAYAENDFQTDVDNMQNGTVPNILSLRNTYAADVVGMIVEESAYCGLAYDILHPVSNAFESSAYAVINRSCSAGNLSLAHEFGHLMGARHDRFVDPTDNSPYHYNHGYVNTTPTPPTMPWRTVMAYADACGSCTRLPYFSNPNITYGGDAMGVASGTNQADNHRVLNNTALTVANFRCSSPSAPNVWMKDTWNDTGAEPDSHTAGEDMWKSPYIWIRNAQDTTLVHQHEHQNPIFGATNWVYVKMHNGGSAAADGHLELYWAHASTGLSWPADWTLLTSIPVTGFAAHGTKIVEYQWTGLPGTGHYCMLARWVSAADPMTFAETSDINYNVRQNNNLIWRNLNIVDLGGDQFFTSTFIVRNNDDRATTLVIRPDAKEVNKSFLKYGVVSVAFDAALQRAWTKGGTQGSGFTRSDESILLTNPNGAVFQNIQLPAKSTGVVTITFRKLPTTPKQVYHVDTVQYPSQQTGTTAPPPVRITGGVSYEISTELKAK